jgi:hypothetical protein
VSYSDKLVHRTTAHVFSDDDWSGYTENQLSPAPIAEARCEVERAVDSREHRSQHLLPVLIADLAISEALPSQRKAGKAIAPAQAQIEGLNSHKAHLGEIPLRSVHCASLCRISDPALTEKGRMGGTWDIPF